ncbi:putative zinc finger protein atl6 [Rosellinia necatrix]|uniref:Putative zinc finger protein atl6 n=1 Tax=Rosellinia necatrix TaxID=77044 RepID=A0A1W2TPE3_ROSNE|nr:putative zinc finger protein atl6 [Rosellinia necatrix]
MHHPNHHHPHYYQAGASSSGSGTRCPAMRAAAEQRNYQLPTISSSRGSVQYDPVHARAGSRDVWQSRSPQNWRPAAIIPPFAQEATSIDNFPSPTPPNQPQQPPCPMPTMTNAPNIADLYPPQMHPYHQFRPTMHPVPRLLGQPHGFPSSNATQSNTQHTPNRPMHRANAGMPASTPMHSAPPVQISASRPPANPIQTGQATSYFGNENIGPNQPLPNILPHIFAQHDHAAQFSRQTPEPVAQPAGSGGGSGSRPTSHSPPTPASASTASQRTNDQPNRIMNPVEIRRASAAALISGRPRRAGAPRFSGSGDWIGESHAMMFRRGDMSLMEFVESFPGAISDGDGPTNARFLRGNTSGKRIASKKALASLQSVPIEDLPESERTCVICYNEFGLENPEGINEAPLRLPKCKHVFGDHCIKKWFQESDSCPYCRDKVHSELQPTPARRSHPGFRFAPQYQLTPQHLPSYQERGQSQSRDRDASESESSHQSGHSMTGGAADRPSSQFPDPGLNTRSPPGSRRFESALQHGMRIPSSSVTYERRSPPVDDRRRRARHRYHWNGSPPPNSNQTEGGVTAVSPPSGPAYDAFPFQSQLTVADDYFHGLVSPNSDVIPASEYPGLPQIRSGAHVGFPPPPIGPSGNYMSSPGRTGPNQFTSYQQS